MSSRSKYVPFLPPNCTCGAGIGGIHTEDCPVYKWMERSGLLHKPEIVEELAKKRLAASQKELPPAQ